MSNKLFTAGEIINIRYNLKEIEKTLGHPIPGGVIDLSELKDRTMSAGEIISTCYNLKEIEKSSKTSSRCGNPSVGTDLTQSKINLVLVGIVGILFLIKFLFF